jgi:hypothetical protein
MENPIKETAWQRANRDTLSAFHTLRFWLLDIISVAIFTLLVLLYTPSWIDKEWKTLYQILVPLFVAVIGLGVLYLVSLVRAPYLQRNEARTLLLNKKSIQIPNKNDLIRAIAELKTSAIQYINLKDTMEWWRRERPHNVNVELTSQLEDANIRYNKALEIFESEKLVAGVDIESDLFFLNTFISLHVLSADIPEIITKEGYSVREIENKINKRVNVTVKKINEG